MEIYLPLYEGKMVSPFDHRSASVEMNPDNLNRQGQPKETTFEELKDPNFLPKPAYWVPEAKVSVAFPQSMGWTLVYRRITAPTNARTTLTTILPWCAVSYTIPMLRTSGQSFSATDAACLQSVMSSFCFDYISRQKLQGTSMSLTSLEQLPVIAPSDYDHKFGHTTARNLVRDHVLRLTYTAHDMAPFARDLGYDGPPFIWNDEAAPPPARPPRRPLLPPLRPIPRRRRLHPRHLPHRPPPRQSRLRHTTAPKP